MMFPLMFPFHFPRQKTPEELQQAKGAADAKEFKDYLNSLTPEARAKFWAEIEGERDSQDERTPTGKQPQSHPARSPTFSLRRSQRASR